MARFDKNYFPKYDQLSIGERAFLRTCCYYPPRPRRQASLESIAPPESYLHKYERAFGPEFWSLIKGKRVLDLGCGEGGYVLALAGQGAGQVIGLDVQANFSLAQEECRRRGYGNAEFIQGTTAVLLDESFDVTISHDSFEHFSNPEEIVAEMSRVTKKDGHLLIKFGPPWRNPWGRHMSGTVRKDRPWVHLLVPEKVIMRCHSVYHNESVLRERFSQLPGGLNKMTLSRFKKILRNTRDISVRSLRISLLFSDVPRLPIVQELLASEVSAHCVRVS
jgi:ubiquinone/menaquinone biosynthesis C-methylase UbiE